MIRVLNDARVFRVVLSVVPERSKIFRQNLTMLVVCGDGIRAAEVAKTLAAGKGYTGIKVWSVNCVAKGELGWMTNDVAIEVTP